MPVVTDTEAGPFCFASKTELHRETGVVLAAAGTGSPVRIDDVAGNRVSVMIVPLKYYFRFCREILGIDPATLPEPREVHARA